MNYRHAFHAGNFADVAKHVVLTRILVYLHDKPTAFRVIDTHAGAGRYDLTSIEAQRGGEWRNGIARLMSATAEGAPPAGMPADVAPLLSPYLDIVRAFNQDGSLKRYPGSPLVARALLRPQDRLVACEVEPQTRRHLIDALRKDEQARVVDLDGWTALGAFVPPKERRGVVMVDPSYEAPDEFDRLAAGVAAAFAKWSTGIYLVWYPAKDRHQVERFAQRIAALLGKALRAEISVSTPSRDGPLAAAGLFILNPPWTLEQDLRVVFPYLAKVLGHDGAGSSRIEALRR